MTLSASVSWLPSRDVPPEATSAPASGRTCAARRSSSAAFRQRERPVGGIRSRAGKLNAPADIRPAIEAALARVACELAAVAEAMAKIELLLQLIASAAGAK